MSYFDHAMLVEVATMRAVAAFTMKNVDIDDGITDDLCGSKKAVD